MIRVVLADDHTLVRAGLRMLLAAQEDIDVVAEAADGRQAVDHARTYGADVVVMDVRMPVLDGITASRILSADGIHTDPDRLTRVLILTTFGEDSAVQDALRAGASGFMLKHAAPQDLVNAVRHLAAGEAWLDPSVAGAVIDAVTRAPRAAPPASEVIDPLTPREREILTLMAWGLTNAEIRTRLTISEATVKTHVARVIMKTGSRDRTQAVVLAYQSGLVRPGGTAPQSAG